MNNQTNRGCLITRWTLGIQTLILFSLVDGLVIAKTAGVATMQEAVAFLTGYLLIAAGTLMTAYLIESGKAIGSAHALAPIVVRKEVTSARRLLR